MSQDLCRCGSINVAIYFFVILFGISSWVDINGLWVELPILVQNLPEGWDLPSYMAVIIQIANISPFIFTAVSTVWPHVKLEVPVIYTIISVGAVSCLLLSFFWNETSVVAGSLHSTALLSLQFFLALVDCTSSVAFLPFMSLFRPQYMTAYFIGEGFSGLIPSLVALGQGAGSMRCIKVPIEGASNNTNLTTISPSSSLSPTVASTTANVSVFSTVATQIYNQTTMRQEYITFPVYEDPKFSVQTFFLFLMCLMVCSGVAFTLLNYWSYCKKEHIHADTEADYALEERIAMKQKSKYDFDDIIAVNGDDRVIMKSTTKNTMVHESKMNKEMKQWVRQPKTSISSSSGSFPEALKKLDGMSTGHYALFLFLTAWLNAIANGVLPSIQTYSCLPYGIQPYHLSVTLSSIANPIACFASFFLEMTSKTWSTVMSIVSTALASYIILTAASSPEPPLVDHSVGAFTIILAWVLTVFMITYTKVSIATRFRKEGRKALLWVGACTQVGSLCGALVTFFLVNFYKLFEIANPCV